MRACVLASATLALAMTACGGGSHGALPPGSPTSPATSAPQSATAAFSLLIPTAPRTSGARRALYISASTQSGTIKVNGGAAVELNLMSGSSSCTTATSGRTCLISVPARVGADTFTLALYDGAFTGGVHTGSQLSNASYTSTIAEGTANVPIPLILDGVPFLYAIAVSQQPTARQTSGGGQAGAAVLTAYDQDFNVIVGPGTYADTNGNVTGFTIGVSSTNYTLALNGGAAAATQHLTSPSDVLTITQTQAALGARLTVTPDAFVQESGHDAYIRPIGFTTGDIESSQASSGASGSQLAAIANQTYGVAVLPNYGAVGQATTTSGVGFATTCGTGFVRDPDMAANAGSTWTIVNGYALTRDYAGCTANPQFAAVSDFGYGTGILSINTGCAIDYQYTPGVFITPGSSAPGNCSLPHDLTGDSTSGYDAFLETNASDMHDHLAIFNGQNLTADDAMTNVYATATASTLTSIATRADAFYVEEPTAGRLWIVSKNGIGTPGFLYLPGGYTYVNNTFQSPLGTAWSNRTMATGSDGLLYIAVSSPSNGVLVIDPTTTTVITFLPNPPAVSGTAVFNVVNDNRGTIYWSAGAYIMHYPSNVSST